MTAIIGDSCFFCTDSKFLPSKKRWVCISDNYNEIDILKSIPSNCPAIKKDLLPGFAFADPDQPDEVAKSYEYIKQLKPHEKFILWMLLVSRGDVFFTPRKFARRNRKNVLVRCHECKKPVPIKNYFYTTDKRYNHYNKTIKYCENCKDKATFTRDIPNKQMIKTTMKQRFNLSNLTLQTTMNKFDNYFKQELHF